MAHTQVNPASITLQHPELLEAAIHGARLDPCQLAAQTAPSWIGRVPLPHSCLDFARLGPAMAFQGVTAGNCYTLFFVTDCPTPGHSFNFSTTHHDGYIGMFPPGAIIDAVTPAGYANATFTVAAETFLEAVKIYCPELPDTVLSRGAPIRVGPVEQARLRAALSTLETALRQNDDLLANPLARYNAEQELLAAFCLSLQRGHYQTPTHLTRNLAVRTRHFLQARDYLAAHQHEPVYMRELSAAIGLSERALEILFKQFYGLTPVAYLRHRRLHTVRSLLMHAQPTTGIIKRTAIECGFLHQGHFARDYRQLFGESPRETLQRAQAKAR